MSRASASARDTNHLAKLSLPNICYQVRTDPNTKLATTAKQFQLQKVHPVGLNMEPLVIQSNAFLS